MLTLNFSAQPGPCLRCGSTEYRLTWVRVRTDAPVVNGVAQAGVLELDGATIECANGHISTV